MTVMRKLHLRALNIGILHFENVILYCRCTKRDGASTVFLRGEILWTIWINLQGSLGRWDFQNRKLRIT